MQVKYSLREVCAWSVTPAAQMRKTVEHRYVDVSYTKPDGSVQSQTLELPTTEAVHLCASMATDDTLSHLVTESHNKWWRPGSLPGLIQLIAAAASKHTKWLTHVECKYIGIRVDMRSGHFIITDSQGTEASAKVFNMLDWPNGNKPHD